MRNKIIVINVFMYTRFAVTKKYVGSGRDSIRAVRLLLFMFLSTHNLLLQKSILVGLYFYMHCFLVQIVRNA